MSRSATVLCATWMLLSMAMIKKVLNEKSNQNEKSCNCRNPELCPLNGNCLTPEVRYEATVNSDLPRYETRIYKGITKRIWKERFKEHKKAFNNPAKRTDSMLSEEVWRIKEAGGTPEVTWRILQRSKAYTPQARTLSNRKFGNSWARGKGYAEQVVWNCRKVQAPVQVRTIKWG